MKAMDVIRKSSNILPRNCLLSICRTIVRLHLIYGGKIYDQPNNESYSRNVESIQYNAAIAIIGAIRRTL